MKDWIRGVLGALRGKPVLLSDNWVLVNRQPSGDFNMVVWRGMTAADAAKVLYQAADAVVLQLPVSSGGFKVH